MAGKATLFMRAEAGATQTALTFDENVGFYADISVGKSLSYRAEFQFGARTIRWPDAGFQALTIVPNQSVTVVADAATAIAPLLVEDTSIKVGAGPAELGIVEGHQSAGIAPESIAVDGQGRVTIPDFANRKAIVVDSAGKSKDVKLGEGPQHAAVLADDSIAYVTGTDLVIADQVGAVKRRSSLAALGVSFPVGLRVDDRGLTVLTPGRRQRLATAAGDALPAVDPAVSDEYLYRQVPGGVEVARPATGETWLVKGMTPTYAQSLDATSTAIVGVIEDQPDKYFVAVATKAGASGPTRVLDAPIGHFSAAPPIAGAGGRVCVLGHSVPEAAAHLHCYALNA